MYSTRYSHLPKLLTRLLPQEPSQNNAVVCKFDTNFFYLSASSSSLSRLLLQTAFLLIRVKGLSCQIFLSKKKIRVKETERCKLIPKREKWRHINISFFLIARVSGQNTIPTVHTTRIVAPCQLARILKTLAYLFSWEAIKSSLSLCPHILFFHHFFGRGVIRETRC